VIYFFTGNFNTDANSWATDANLAAMLPVFAPADVGPSVNTTVYAQLSITPKLADLWDAEVISGLEPSTVVPYLKENLHWQIRTVSHFFFVLFL
jgi:hypothetical protein